EQGEHGGLARPRRAYDRGVPTVGNGDVDVIQRGSRAWCVAGRGSFEFQQRLLVGGDRVAVVGGGDDPLVVRLWLQWDRLHLANALGSGDTRLQGGHALGQLHHRGQERERIQQERDQRGDPDLAGRHPCGPHAQYGDDGQLDSGEGDGPGERLPPYRADTVLRGIL